MGNLCKKKASKAGKQNSMESFLHINVKDENTLQTKEERQLAATEAAATTTDKTRPPDCPNGQLKEGKAKKNVQNENILVLSNGIAGNSLKVQSVIPNVRRSKDIQTSDDDDKPKPDYRSFPITEFSECKIDKMVLRMCPKYIGVNGCNEMYCYRFHVCSYWVKGTCRKAECSKDHHFQSKHNQNMFRFLQNESFGEPDLKIQLKRNSYKDKKLWEEISPVICSRFILRQCTKTECVDYHAKSLFCWEMYFNDKWNKFPNDINKTIEKSYSDPSISEIVLNFNSNKINTSSDSLHTSSDSLHTSSDSLRFDLIFPGKLTKINFDLMQLLTPENASCNIRRVTTLSDMVYFTSVATRWLWYWKSPEDKDNWKFYSNAVVNEFTVIAFSDYIETQYLKKSKEFEFKFQPGGNNFKIDFDNMAQIDTRTSVSVAIQRRPVPFHQLNNRIVNSKKC